MISDLGILPLAIAAAGYLLGGFVKGAVGFALPLVAVSISASVLPAQTAVGIVILPVLITNSMQALAQGVAAFRETLARFWPLTLTTAGMIVLSAQLLPGINERLFFAILGFVAGFAALVQLLGWRPTLAPQWERPAGFATGLVGGFSGGIAGVWGPPTILFLTALSLPKVEQVRAAGLVFMLGAFTLAPAHVGTGVLTAEVAVTGLAMTVPALFGQWVGQRMQDRMDLTLFRKVTLLVLLAVSLNLLRRALFG